MKLISFFTGTDALLISKWNIPCRPYKRIYQISIRLRTWLFDFFVYEYWVPHVDLLLELRKFGITKRIRIKKDELKYPEKFEKRKHDGFNILYYWPDNQGNALLWRWVYGYDIYQNVKKILGNKLNWIIVDGSKDMMEIFPIVDFYLRPNRHDGWSRLIDECKINEIPFYYSRKNPDINEALRLINNAIDRKA